MSWSNDLFSFWDVASDGAFFTINFPWAATGYNEGCCMRGEWTITKISNIWVINFRKEDNVLIVPPVGQHIEAAATSPTVPYTYHLTRQTVREILEWAEQEGIRPTAQGQRQLERAAIAIEASS